MTLHGDLATLELADIVQNLEMHQKSGTLTIEGPRKTRRIYFRKGKIALLTADERPSLIEDLVAAGMVSIAEVEKAKGKRWRTRKSLGEVLVKRGPLDADELAAFAQARLVEDVCDALASSSGTFEFVEEGVPRNVFDPEERRLELALPVGPVLFEAARRSDHMPLIRARVPTDSTYFFGGEAAGAPVEGDPALAQALLARLNGTRSVREVMRAFPEQRFAAYEMLAALVEARVVRPASADDLAGLARARSDDDAWRLIRDALEAEPHHLGLLQQKTDLAERRKDPESAAEALKVLAHLKLEAGDRESAREDLQRARALAPEDTSLWERTLELAVQDDRREDALRAGQELARLYREPGLHAKACAVYERLVELEPASWELRQELARSQVDSGNPSLAVTTLERHGKKLLGAERYDAAREVFQEVLEVMPDRRQARRMLEQIDNKVFERRRARRRRYVRRAVTVLVIAASVFVVARETSARIDYARANRSVSRLDLIERREYRKAADLFAGVADRHPFTWTSLYDVRQRLADLRAKIDR